MTTFVQSAKANPPAVSAPVPLGAQSVIQAGDPGPGGVRYLPVPMAAIPELRRASAPPITSPAQAYGMSGRVPATSASNLANAFGPDSSRAAVAQATNAFGAGGQTIPAAPSGQAVPGFAPAIKNATNSSVITAGLQGGVPNQNVAATYRPITQQTQLGSTSSTAAQSVPENIRQMQVGLRDSLYPSQREWAAENMATVDWRLHPQVIQFLTTAAKEDPAATVRATCLRCLAKMKANTAPVITVVRGLRIDSDPRVRQEAERAMAVLAAGQK